jgi:RNA ligase
MFLDMEKVRQLVADGYISVRKHPNAPLFIYNYTPKCQYEWHWTPETIACRGLILDDRDNVVARPFPKFFTPDQYRDLRNNVHNLFGICYKDLYQGGFKVTEKVDGSMGVLYHYNGALAIASRGSFESEQAVHATKILQEKYGEFPFVVDPDCTYIFEIVYPDNRIVVDYEGLDDIVLLTVLNNENGEDLPDLVRQWQDAGGLAAKSYCFAFFDNVLNEQQVGREGFVVKFDSGLRVKVKFEDYIRLHRILTNMSARDIWERLRNNEPLDDLLEVVPDEFYNWVRKIERDLTNKYREIEQHAQGVIQRDVVKCNTPLTRKQLAIKHKNYQYKGIMFNMLDNKEYADSIWRIIRPKAELPFSTTDEKDR